VQPVWPTHDHTLAGAAGVAGAWFIRTRGQIDMLCAIDRFALSTDGAAPSTDLLFAQASIDRAAIDGSRCAIDR